MEGTALHFGARFWSSKRGALSFESVSGRLVGGRFWSSKRRSLNLDGVSCFRFGARFGTQSGELWVWSRCEDLVSEPFSAVFWSSERGALNFLGGSWGGLGRGVALAKHCFSAFWDGVFEWFLELRRRAGVFFELQAGKGKWRYRAQETADEKTPAFSQ